LGLLLVFIILLVSRSSVMSDRSSCHCTGNQPATPSPSSHSHGDLLSIVADLIVGSPSVAGAGSKVTELELLISFVLVPP
jgi:hypothetical protein